MVAAIFLVIAVLGGISPSAADTAENPAALPPQGLYEGCAPAGEECISRLAVIRAAGFHYVLNYSAWYGSPAEVVRYADAAAALGLRLIWPLNHPAWRGLANLATTYPTLAENRTGMASEEITAHAVGLVANHPATWGFYIGDELPAAEAGRVRELGAAVRELAPEKPQLYVARPGAARLKPFAAFADVAGSDPYPIGSADPLIRHAARSTRQVTFAADVRTAMVLQAFSWSQYLPDTHAPLYPSESTLRTMRDAAIRHARPSMILWYSYQDILRSDDPDRRWRDLTHAVFSKP